MGSNFELLLLFHLSFLLRGVAARHGKRDYKNMLLRSLLFSRPAKSAVAATAVGMTMLTQVNRPAFSTTAAAAAAAAASSGPQITLYQYQVCPFCNKLQTYLEYHKIPHKRVEVNPLSKKEMKFSEYKMVPFVVVEEEGKDKMQVNGSDVVIDWLAKEVVKEDNNANEDSSVQEWRKWCDDHLIHLLPPNIYRTPGESLQAFGYISNSSNFSALEKASAKYVGALAMYFIAQRSLKKYNIKDARLELQQAMDKWASVGIDPSKGPFHGGNKPDKADLSVYGVIRSIEGNYATWRDMQDKVHPKFWTWYQAVKKEISPPVLLE